MIHKNRQKRKAGSKGSFSFFLTSLCIFSLMTKPLAPLTPVGDYNLRPIASCFQQDSTFFDTLCCSDGMEGKQQ